MKNILIFTALIISFTFIISSGETLYSQRNNTGLTLVERLEGKYYYYNDLFGRFLTKKYEVDDEPVAVAYHVVSSSGYVWSKPRFLIQWDARKMVFVMAISVDGESVSSTSDINPGTVLYEVSQILSKCHKVPPNK